MFDSTARGRDLFWAVATLIFILTAGLGLTLFRTLVKLYIERQGNRPGWHINCSPQQLHLEDQRSAAWCIVRANRERKWKSRLDHNYEESDFHPFSCRMLRRGFLGR
jgi:hypothetical protein